MRSSRSQWARENYHLYKFKVGKHYYGETEPKSWALGAFGSQIENAGMVRLSDVAPNARATFTYLYDLGNSWSHEVRVERVLASEAERRYPSCLGGERACPPEDCGGVWGYADLLAALEAPDDPESAERLDWAGPFDPEKFDLDAVNARLAEFGARTQRGSR